MGNKRYTWRNLITLIGVIIMVVLVWSMLSTLSKKDYNNLGLEEFQQRNYEKAIEYFTKAIEADPDNAKAYHNRGLALFKTGNWRNKKPYEKAISDYSRAIELDPNYLDAYYNRGIAYEQFIHYTAKPFSDDVIEKYNKAIKDFGKVLELDSTYKLAYAGKGNILYRYGEFEKATEAYNKALESEDLIVEKVGKRGLASVYASSGRNYKQYLKFDESIASYNKALELEPRLIEAYGEFLGTYLVTKDYAKAVERYNKWIDLLENDPEFKDYEWGYSAYYGRGVALYELKRYEEAISDFEKLLATKKMDLPANKYLGLLYSETGKDEKAEKAFEMAIEKLSRSIDKGKGEARTYNDRGLCYMGLKEYHKAISDFEKVIELKPEPDPHSGYLYIEAHKNLGMVYSEIGNKDKAREFYEKALRFSKDKGITKIEQGIDRLIANL